MDKHSSTPLHAKNKKNGDTESGLLKKLFFDKLTKNEMEDVLFYYKQIIGILLGLISGFIRIKGFWGFLFFTLFQYIFSFVLYNKKIDPHYYLSNFNIVSCHFFVGLSTFVLTWVVIHTFLLE